jgi:hypothetical protein
MPNSPALQTVKRPQLKGRITNEGYRQMAQAVVERVERQQAAYAAAPKMSCVRCHGENVAGAYSCGKCSESFYRGTK